MWVEVISQNLRTRMTTTLVRKNTGDPKLLDDVERYPNLKEEVGMSISSCEISSLLDKKLAIIKKTKTPRVLYFVAVVTKIQTTKSVCVGQPNCTCQSVLNSTPCFIHREWERSSSIACQPTDGNQIPSARLFILPRWSQLCHVPLPYPLLMPTSSSTLNKQTPVVVYPQRITWYETHNKRM